MFRLLKMFWFLKPIKETILWRGSSGTAVTMQQLGTSWRKKKTFRKQKRIWKGIWVNVKRYNFFYIIICKGGNLSALISCKLIHFQLLFTVQLLTKHKWKVQSDADWWDNNKRDNKMQRKDEKSEKLHWKWLE